MRKIAWKIVLASLMFPSILMAQTRPSEDVSIGSVRQLNMLGFNYLYVDTKATQKTIAEISQMEIPRLFVAMKIANIESHGPLVYIFHGRTGDPNAVFDMKIGIAVNDDAVAPSGYAIDSLEPIDCKTVLYGGPLAQIGSAFGKLMPALHGGNSTPTGEIREYFLYFENADSPNNVTLILGVVK